MRFHLRSVWRVSLFAGVLLVGSAAATVRAQSGNPLLDDLMKTGVPMGQAGARTLRPPTLPDGLSAAEQRKAIEAVLAVRPGQPLDYAGFTAPGLNTPHVFIIDDAKLAPATGPGHTTDLWFTVHDKLAKVAAPGFLRAQFKPGPKNRLDTLQAADLKQRNIAEKKIAGGKESYAHATSLIFPTDVRVQVDATGRAVQTTTDTSTTLASLIDPRFDNDATFPNQWRPVLRAADGSILRDAAGKLQLGNPTPYESAGGYTKVTELVEPAGTLLVEYHLVYDEPYGWFSGADLLRPKLYQQTQEDVQTFRKKLRLSPMPAASPPPAQK